MKLSLLDVNSNYFRHGPVKQSREVLTLIGDDGRPWMSDDGQERVYMGSAARWIKTGDTVLTAGLGLGVFPKMALNQGASRITIVERDERLLSVMRSHFPDFFAHPAIEIIPGDIHEFMKSTLRHWNFAYIDIWAGNSDSELIDRYICLAQAKQIATRAMCWQLWSMEQRIKSDLEEIEELRVGDGIPTEDFGRKLMQGGYVHYGLYYLGDKWNSIPGFIKYVREHPDACSITMWTLFANAQKQAGPAVALNSHAAGVLKHDILYQVAEAGVK